MLGLGSYLLGIGALAILAGSAWLGASAIRQRLLPEFSGAPAVLATSVLALAILILTAQLLGTVGLFKPLPYLVAVALAGWGIWALLPRVAWGKGGRGRPRPQHPPSPRDRTRGQGVGISAVLAALLGLAAVLDFIPGVRDALGTGMTGFDSTWYHGPFAAGFFQSGNTWDLHFIAPQFLAWFYPANAEIFHSVGMLAFDRDVLSPLLNLGWFIGCLFAFWSIGRPHGVGLFSVLLGALVLRAPLLADQAGEARNDLAGTFFLLAAVAVMVSAAASGPGDRRRLSTGALIAAGLAAGLAAGTKLNFLLPAAVLVVGMAVIAPAGARLRALGVGVLAALAGGGYWYLRNLIQSGNPLPWFTDIGPISLPGPEQALGGREGHSVLGYLTDGAVWSDWLLPGFHDGLTALWPLFLGLGLAGLLLSLGHPRANPVLRLAGAVGVAAALAWLVAPTSASGPEGMPRGFESGLRYLAPALMLGMALLPIVVSVRLRRRAEGYPPNGRILKVPTSLGRHLSGRRIPLGPLTFATALIAIAVGYPIQRHYLDGRYADPSFTTPGLNAAFAWSRDVSGSRIATTSTRQYPLFGTDLSNRVEFVGVEQDDGGFVAPTDCTQWRRLLNAGGYDYVVTSRDRIGPGQPPFPPSTTWTESPDSKPVLRKPPTVIFKLSGPLDPSACQGAGRTD
jgi:hypothetical protein